jgi:hypothetical protein
MAGAEVRARFASGSQPSGTLLEKQKVARVLTSVAFFPFLRISDTLVNRARDMRLLFLLRPASIQHLGQHGLEAEGEL